MRFYKLLRYYMKYFVSITLSVFALYTLAGCSSDIPPTPIEWAPEAVNNNANAPIAPQIPITGHTASGQAVPYGAPEVVSTEVPKNVKILKKEYTDSSGKKAIFEWAIVLDENGSIREIQIFNPSGDSERFAKEVTKEVVGRNAQGLALETIDGLEGIVDAFNTSIAETMGK